MEDPVPAPRPDQEEDNDDMEVTQEEAAAAAAQVELMEGHFQRATGRGESRRANDQAVLGANQDNVEAYEATDESGTVVAQRFLQFLESL